MNEPNSNPVRLRRSVLYVPADNHRAIEKSLTLPADCIIYDLEDANAPEKKAEARENLRIHFSDHPNSAKERGIRINGLNTEWGTEDLMSARYCHVDAVVLSKVESTQDVSLVSDALDEADAPENMKIFAMIETALGVVNASQISMLGQPENARLSCLMVGINDLVKQTLIDGDNARSIAHSWMMQIVLAARAGGVDVVDAVYNDFRDLDGFVAECEAGAKMGFDGKSLIHPAQIDGANRSFGPSAAALSEAAEIVRAFSRSENAGKGVIQIDGKMVERLHLMQAQTLLAKAEMAKDHKL
mgnify:CR=1 FL=1